MRGLRKINKDGIHYNFQWPLEVGAVVKAPDWNPEPVCGGGLHLLPEAKGDYDLLDGHFWAVVEFDESAMVRIGEDKAKVPECKIVYLSEVRNGLFEFFDVERFDSRSAYYWATYIGNQDVMIDRVTDSEYAYYWARDIGNEDIMIDRVTDSEWAYRWARGIGNKDIMIDRVTDSESAYYWACHIGNQDIMIDRVTDSQWVYYWAYNIGNQDIMID